MALFHSLRLSAVADLPIYYNRFIPIFEKNGFILKGLFDANPRLEGVSIRGVPIRMMDELKTFVLENNIDIAVLTIPKTKAVEVAELLAGTGIKGIWNFAHTDLHLPKNVIVETPRFINQSTRFSKFAIPA